jgi:hypothetical protein
MGKLRYDWQAIRKEYTTTPVPITKTALAAKYGMNLTNLIHRSVSEQWDVQRDRFLARVEEQTTEKKAEAVATEGAQWDATCMEKAKALMALVDDELKGQIVLDKLGNQVLIQRAAKDIASAVKVAQEVGKSALGDKAETTVKVEGRLDLSIEQVIKEYADSDIGAVPTENRPQ